MATVVERMIPERYLLQHAIYMQTCAHIELATWHIVLAVEGIDRQDQAETERFLKVKKETWTLIKALRDSSNKCATDLSLRIAALAERIKLGVEDRNFAAHGAIFWDEENRSIAAEHYFQRKVEGKSVWYRILGQPITDESIRFAIGEADNILREAINIRAALEVEQTPNILL